MSIINIFTIKNIRMTAGGAFSCSLYENGKRVAVITNDGRGGPDSIEPILTGGKIWRTEVARLEAALTEWAKSLLPEWYLTSHGTHERLEPHWELAVGYLSERAEYESLARKAGPGFVLLRLPDGALRYSLPNHPSTKGSLIWADGDWVAAGGAK